MPMAVFSTVKLSFVVSICVTLITLISIIIIAITLVSFEASSTRAASVFPL